MKKAMLMLVGGVLLLATPSCKKGENDPFLSLKSRKARLAGGYVVSKMESIEKINGENYETVTTITFDGETVFEKIDNSGGQSPESYTYPVTSAEWVFKKDGTWEMAWIYVKTVIVEDDYYKTTTITNYNQTQSGTWSFIGKLKKQYKNKERVQLSILKEDIIKSDDVTSLDKISNTTTSSKTQDNNNATYANGENVLIYDIDMLKNKEMVFKLSNEQNFTSHYDDGFSTPYDYIENTLLEKTITLKQIKKVK